MNRTFVSLLVFFVAVVRPCVAQDTADATSEVARLSEMSDSEKISESDFFKAFKADWNKDFGIQVGMPVDELKSYIKKNNEKARNAKPPEWVTERFHPPAFAYPELRLHVFVNHNGTADKRTAPNYLSYWVNGRTQFWLDMAIKDGKIENIFVSFGNGTVRLPPVRLAGGGQHRSRWTDHNRNRSNVEVDRNGDGVIDDADIPD